MNIVRKIKNILPNYIVELAIDKFIEVNKIAGNNFFEYEIMNKSVAFRYENENQVRMFYNLIDNGVLVNENIPISYLEDVSNVSSFIDVGAHYGLYSVLIGKIEDDIDIYSFEPSKKNRSILKNNLELNGIRSDIRNEVVSGKDGVVQFFTSKKSSLAHSTSPAQGLEEKRKKAIRLKKFIKDKSMKSVFVKIDAEGEEYNILNDITAGNENYYIYGIFECHPDKMEVEEKEMVEMLNKRGYKCEFICDTTPSSRNSRNAYFFEG